MRGLMMDQPLLIISLIQFAAKYHGDTEIVSHSVEGPIHRYNYRDSFARIGRLAHALRRLGVAPGDRVATLAWNGYRHFELYFAISGIGAICHTINPRLFHDQLRYIVNHAEDKYLFVDLTFVPLVKALAADFKTLRGVVIMTDRDHMPETSLENALCYEELLAGETEDYDWPVLDENTGSSLCYTSGTTGNPKGALYSHRALVLHSFSVCTGNVFRFNATDTLLPVVPMFHANAWGLAHAAPMAGAKLVLPGADYSGAALYELFEQEEVTTTAGVPTVWFVLLDHLESTGKTLPHLKFMGVGGAAAPPSMIKTFQEDYGVVFCHAWGMTEMSPVGTTGCPRNDSRKLSREERYKRQAKQGRALFGVDMKIVDDSGAELPHDGKTFGELLVRGPWVISAYYKDEAATRAAFDADGWFRTGDIANIDAFGHMQIVDRSKDLIKSGGEWISSIDLENTAVAHPAVAEAAVIGLPHPKWDERPLLVLVPVEGQDPSTEEIRAFLSDKVAKWWMPDDVVFVDEMPHTATGKISKLTLRERFKGHRLPTA